MRTAPRRTLELEARDILWDASRGVLYVSVPSSEPRGNTVGAVDPLTLERTFDVFVGSEPGAMLSTTEAPRLSARPHGRSSSAPTQTQPASCAADASVARSGDRSSAATAVYQREKSVSRNCTRSRGRGKELG